MLLLSDIGGRPDILDVPPVAKTGPLQAEKKHSFHNWRGKERREALSISASERSQRARKGARRVLVYAPGRATQARLTGGAEAELKTSP